MSIAVAGTNAIVKIAYEDAADTLASGRVEAVEDLGSADVALIDCPTFGRHVLVTTICGRAARIRC